MVRKRARANKPGGDGGAREGVPRDAKRIKLLVESMGVKGYEPRVIHQLLDLMHRTVVDTLEEAFDFADHAGRAGITVEDVRLAIAMGLQRGEYSRRPSMSILSQMAAECNKRKLPDTSKSRSLPPPRDRFVEGGRLRNWHVVVPARCQRFSHSAPIHASAEDAVPMVRRAPKQIPIQLSGELEQAAAANPEGAGGDAPAMDLQDALALLQEQPQNQYDDDDDEDAWENEQPAA
mmetsp:Transcript_26955/g.79475  ORF Transcript_26955/g.79475 Transcript_26955/m.79475 type:complete len:234 (-) Transcript_26955:185-886(-)